MSIGGRRQSGSEFGEYGRLSPDLRTGTGTRTSHVFEGVDERSTVVQAHRHGKSAGSSHTGSAMGDDVPTAAKTRPHVGVQLDGSLDIGGRQIVDRKPESTG